MSSERCSANSSPLSREGQTPTAPPAGRQDHQHRPALAGRRTAVWLTLAPILFAYSKLVLIAILTVIMLPVLVFAVLLLWAVELEDPERVRWVLGLPRKWWVAVQQTIVDILRRYLGGAHRQEMDTGVVSSPRRKRQSTANGIASWGRTASNNSSNSSDILVAGPAAHTTPTRPEQQRALPARSPWSKSADMAVPTTTHYWWGRLKIHFGSNAAKEAFRNIVKSKPNPIFCPNRTSSAHIDNLSEDDEGQEGPNHLGTYSKQYTLDHPEIKWMHRGSGRYVKADDLRPDFPVTSPRSTRQVAAEHYPVAPPFTDEQLDELHAILGEQFDIHRKVINPACKPNWSPTQKSQFNSIWALIKQTPKSQWHTLPALVQQTGHSGMIHKWIVAVEQQMPQLGTSESRSRLTRQAKTTSYVEQRRSSRPRNSVNNIFDSDDEAGDESDEPEDQEIMSDNGNEEPPALSMNDTVHADDLHLYPGQAFYHTGNRFYRPGIGPHGAHGSIAINEHGVKRKYSDFIEETKAAKEDDDESELADSRGTFSKEYVQRHPEIAFKHRGKGRYRRCSDIATASATPVASSERRSSRADNSFTKDYAESHFSDEFTRSGRGKRNSKARMEMEESLGVLFDKHYVDTHPNELFHHRGQGKYARGPRNIRAPASKEEVPPPASVVEEAFDEGLVSSQYVDSHPNETFHHRGQGKWARGLPPPGSSNKTAVRGPGRDGMMDEEVDAEGNRPPGLTALVLKVDGPEKWPNLHWVYRGGGKWCRTSKEEIQRAAMPPAPPRRPRTSVYARVRTSGADAQLQRESLAAEESTGGTRWSGQDTTKSQSSPRQPKTSRRRGVRTTLANNESKNSSNSQSKAPTPRPALLSPEEDILTDIDFPTLYKPDWTPADLGGNTDQASRIQARKYRSIVGPEPYVTALTKHDPAVRSLSNLKLLAANAQQALLALQAEYLDLDKIVAIHPMNGKKERKPVKGGRQTVEPAVFEDRKEALLYDYTFDPRKIGYQDPDAQRIIRDGEGRELRRRRNRVGADNSLPNGVNYGDGEMTAKRTVKPISRFDGVVVQAPRKRSRLSTAPGNDETPSQSRPETPVQHEVEGTRPSRQRGRAGEHVPKRIRELRHGSVLASGRSASEESTARMGASVAGSVVDEDVSDPLDIRNLINDNGNGEGDMSATINPSIEVPPPSNEAYSANIDAFANNAAVSPAGSPGPFGEMTSAMMVARKGRPPGSKNLHKRRDAGIKKGPRKPKVVGGEETGTSVEPDGGGDEYGDVMMADEGAGTEGVESPVRAPAAAAGFGSGFGGMGIGMLI
ncbi:unnamed protein product [Zymoseptoria tritici ST99CH_3D1]|nr:unnamed protein product [Zymoseptoria tritici ST99CH_3D1]